jgi:hypothetical protein
MCKREKRRSRRQYYCVYDARYYYGLIEMSYKGGCEKSIYHFHLLADKEISQTIKA